MGATTFTEDGWDDYIYWQTQDKKTLRKINELIKEIQRDPFAGKGKPEPLKGELSGLWSIRIDSANRIVYKYEDGTMTIYQCRTHYGDK